MTDRTPKSTDAAGRRSRRQFTKTVAATLLTAVPLASSVASAQTPPATRETKAPPTPPTPADAAQTPSPIAEAYMGVARARFGARVTPEELEKIKEGIAGNVRAAERLAAFKLKNADEPDFVFSV